MVRNTVISDDMRRVIREEVQPIVREELYAIGNDIADIKHTLKMHGDVLGTHGMQLQALRADMASMQAHLRAHAQNVTRIDVLLDDLHDRLLSTHELQ